MSFGNHFRPPAAPGRLRPGDCPFPARPAPSVNISPANLTFTPAVRPDLSERRFQKNRCPAAARTP
ncbi:MAG: hypothetical protein LBK52_07055, partial [Deltaproteobacteria bacterium]|nr:hypothetical protein [Deltaproteobacteria bacterium]